MKQKALIIKKPKVHARSLNTETEPHMKHITQNAPMLNLYTIQLDEILWSTYHKLDSDIPLELPNLYTSWREVTIAFAVEVGYGSINESMKLRAIVSLW